MAINYTKWGNGKKVLIFLHYFGGDANCWKWVTNEISAEFTCIAINLPGFGNTLPPLVPSLLNYALVIKKFIRINGMLNYSLIGHSMGGKIALQLAAIDGDNIKNVVLIAPSPPGMEPISAEVKLQLLQVPAIAEAADNINSLTVEPLSKLKLSTAVNAQLVTNVFIRNWWVNIGSRHSIIKELAKITCRITVLSSRSDPAIKYDVVKKNILPFMRKSIFVEMKNSGHLYPLEIPVSIAAEIENSCK